MSNDTNSSVESTEADTIKKRRTRGPGKKPALAVTSLRLPRDVMDYFSTHYPLKKQAKMREVLTNFVKEKSNENVQSAESA